MTPPTSSTCPRRPEDEWRRQSFPLRCSGDAGIALFGVEHRPLVERVAAIEDVADLRGVDGSGPVPTGYLFNLDGTATYLTMASVFIADALGRPMAVTSNSGCWRS